jgi:hypothetical protein
MKIFAERPLSEFLEQRREAVVREIQSEPQDRLLNVNEAHYVNYVAQKYRLEPVAFAFDAMRASSAEKLVPAENHPPLFHVRAGQSYPRQAITFHVPFTGEPELLRRAPSTRIDWTCEVTVAACEIQFDVINWRNDPEALQGDKQRIVDSIIQQNTHLTEEVTQFNSRLEGFVRQTLSGRKAQLLTQHRVLGSLGMPLESGVPRTFAVPIVPKKLVVKPSAPVCPSPLTPLPGGEGNARAGTSPPLDPTLDNETYQDILSIIHDFGVAMERHPSTYANKHEEDLRDLFVANLSPQYRSTTGETFNKKGCTDILVRHEGSNIFVAECKFWGGVKGFHSTIDQLLSYLTWRDSKAALVYFVKNNQLGPVLQMIGTGAREHPCFIRLESTRDESWMQFEFRLPSDPSRNVHLAVLAFHFPPAWIEDI